MCNNKRSDCIYFEEEFEFVRKQHTVSCRKSGYLMPADCADFCASCRLWDNYIPVSSTHEEIKKAKSWQNMKDQPDYEDYFNT